MNHAGCSPFPRIWGAMASPPSDTVFRRPVPSPGCFARFGRTRGPALSITRSPSAIRCTCPASLARARHVTEWMLPTAAGRGPVCGRENRRPCCDRTRWPSSPPDAVPYVHATSAEVNDNEHARIFRGSVARRSTHRLSRDGGRETHGRRAREAAVLLLRVPAAADLLTNRRRLALLLCAVLHSPRTLSAWLLPKRLLTPPRDPDQIGRLLGGAHFPWERSGRCCVAIDNGFRRGRSVGSAAPAGPIGMRSSIRVQTDLTAAHESLTDNGIHAPTYPGRQHSAFQSGKERDNASTPPPFSHTFDQRIHRWKHSPCTFPSLMCPSERRHNAGTKG